MREKPFTDSESGMEWAKLWVKSNKTLFEFVAKLFNLDGKVIWSFFFLTLIAKNELDEKGTLSLISIGVPFLINAIVCLGLRLESTARSWWYVHAISSSFDTTKASALASFSRLRMLSKSLLPSYSQIFCCHVSPKENKRYQLVTYWSFVESHIPDTSGTLLDNSATHSPLRNTLKMSHNNNRHHVIVEYSHI